MRRTTGWRKGPGTAVRKPGKSWPIFLSLAVLLLALPTACGDEEEQTSAPAGTPAATVTGTVTPAPEVPGITDTQILLGADCPITGATAAVYSTIPLTINAYFKYVNETQGGVCGREIVYKVEDSQGDPAKAVEVVRKLVEQDKVFAIVGSLGDIPHPAVWEYLNENEVPDILCSAGSHMFGADPEGHPWTVQMLPSYKIEGIFYGRYISENLPGEKVAILYPNNPMGTDGLEGLKEGLDPEKNEIVSEQRVTPGAVSARSEIANMNASGADVAVLFLDPASTAYTIKEADRLAWHPQWFISYLNSDEIMFMLVSPELLEGAITFQAVKLVTWTDDPAVAEHLRILHDYGGPAHATNFTVYAQVLAETAVEVLRRSCDNLTREGLMDAVESLQDFHSDLLLDGVNVSFSKTDHTGLQTGKMLRAVIEDGEGKFEYFGPLYVFEGE
jgi:branched-chain amino acid transport system substrate-binding protein